MLIDIQVVIVELSDLMIVLFNLIHEKCLKLFSIILWYSNSVIIVSYRHFHPMLLFSLNFILRIITNDSSFIIILVSDCLITYLVDHRYL
jgi:hypothetical protein